MEPRMIAAASSANAPQMSTAQFSIFGAACVVAILLGLAAQGWITAPLRATRLSRADRLYYAELRQRGIALVMALVCYYVPALTIVSIHAGWPAVVPYLRAHLFDGFGCAALFGVVLGQLWRPLPDTAPRVVSTKRPREAPPVSAERSRVEESFARATVRNREMDRLQAAHMRAKAAASQLASGSAIIAAAAAWVAGGGWLAVILSMVFAAIALGLFWGQVTKQLAYALLDIPAASESHAEDAEED